jgi:hypothetical protein
MTDQLQIAQIVPVVLANGKQLEVRTLRTCALYRRVVDVADDRLGLCTVVKTTFGRGVRWLPCSLASVSRPEHRERSMTEPFNVAIVGKRTKRLCKRTKRL